MLNSKLLSFAEKLNEHPYIVTIRAMGLHILPIFVISSLLTLLMHGLPFLNFDKTYPQIYKTIEILNYFIIGVFPYIITIFIGSFSKYYKKINNDTRLIYLPTLALFIFNIITDKGLIFQYNHRYVRGIIISYSVIFLVKNLYKKNKFIRSTLRIRDRNLKINKQFYFYLFIVSIISIFAALFYAKFLQGFNFDLTGGLKFSESMIPITIYILVIGVGWFFGIHGALLVTTASEYLHMNSSENLSAILEGLTAPHIIDATFVNVYVFMGGSGATLSLAIALLFNKDKKLRRFAKFAIIPGFFNINEIIIFGLPIVANIYLLIPFIGVPFIFAALSYAALYFNIIPVATFNPAWITPPIINSYIATKGSISAVIFQILLIILGAFIYNYFLKKYEMIAVIKPKGKFSFLRGEVRGENIARHQLDNLDKIVEAKSKIEKLETTHKSLIKFLPIFNIQTGEIYKVEAFLFMESGEEIIFQASFLKDYDLLRRTYKINRRIINQCLEYERILFRKKISIPIIVNINPHYFNHSNFIRDMSVIAMRNNITELKLELQLLEESFKNCNSGVCKNSGLLRQKGFKLILDDFGTGYSSLSHLIDFDIDNIKLDKKFLTKIDSRNGKKIFFNIIELANSIDTSIIIKGVHLESQYDFLKQNGIQYAQGSYFSDYMSFDQLVDYLKNN